MLEAFDRYVKAAEGRIDERVRTRDYLWADDSPERMKMVRDGQVAVSPLIGKGDAPLADAMVHDWIGAVFVPGVTLAQTLASVQDYDRNKLTHRPDVIDSKLLAHNGNDFRVYLRLMKKKVMTVVLDTEHDVRYFPVDATFCYSRSYSTPHRRRWITPASRTSGSFRRARATASCGGSTPTGVFSRKTAACTSSARPSRSRATCPRAWAG